VTIGLRILSAYPIDPAKPCNGFGENTLWIITEANRSADDIPFARRILTVDPGPRMRAAPFTSINRRRPP
jgi:hypothetical protein